MATTSYRHGSLILFARNGFDRTRAWQAYPRVSPDTWQPRPAGSERRRISCRRIRSDTASYGKVDMTNTRISTKHTICKRARYYVLRYVPRSTGPPRYVTGTYSEERKREMIYRSNVAFGNIDPCKCATCCPDTSNSEQLST